MRVLLDTSRYRDFSEGDKEALEVMQSAVKLYVPFVVVAELRSGFLCGNKSRQNEKYLTLFLNSSRVEVLYPEENTTHHYAAIFAQLRLQGTPLPVNDIWIAALAVQYDLLLFSRDTRFDKLPQVARI